MRVRPPRWSDDTGMVSLKQSQMAEKIDVSAEMISRIERGQTAPSFKTIEKLSEALSYPEAAFFGTGLTTVPGGERGNLLHKINRHLGKMNVSELAKAEAVLAVLKGR